MEYLDDMYEEAFNRFRVDTGTRYLSNQAELDYHWDALFKLRNKGPFVSSSRATQDMLEHNDLHRRVSTAEGAAMSRLQDLIKHVQRGGYWGPDVAVKTFKDLDLVFFGGYLQGHVCVCWDVLEPNMWGLTEFPEKYRDYDNQCHIVLNADLIFSRRTGKHPFKQTMHTLLHEMVHALDTARCPHTLDLDSDGHDKHFGTRIGAVDQRAKAILGLSAVGPEEMYKKCHFIRDSRGRRWNQGHVQSTRSDKRRKVNHGPRREDRKGRRGVTGEMACTIM